MSKTVNPLPALGLDLLSSVQPHVRVVDDAMGCGRPHNLRNRLGQGMKLDFALAGLLPGDFLRREHSIQKGGDYSERQNKTHQDNR